MVSHLMNTHDAVWPKITIVTPSFNQGAFLEETIRSVVGQNYPNLEYIIIDGGSTDNSVAIIQKYVDHLAYWVSEPDKGQSDALCKGFAHATGDIVAYLNSDDVYIPQVLSLVAQQFCKDPDLALLHGDIILIDAQSRPIRKIAGQSGDILEFYRYQINPIQQSSAFWRRQAMTQVGGIDPALHMIMDYDLWCRMGLRHLKFKYMATNLSMFRWHKATKTTNYTVKAAQEFLQVLEKYLANPDFAEQLKPIQHQVYASIYLRFAAAHWFRGEKHLAYQHYRSAIQAAPGAFFFRTSLNLLLRFLLQIHSFRQIYAHLAGSLIEALSDVRR